MATFELPLPLRFALESGRAVLFLGAGIGFNAHDPDGKPMPTGRVLCGEICVHFGIDPAQSDDLAQVAQLVEIRHGRAELDAFLSKRLADFVPDDSLKWLIGLTWRAIYTTNYDRVIERCYDLSSNPKQKPIPISAASKFRQIDPRFEIPIYHLHGALYDVPQPRLLLTETDYARFREGRRMLFEQFKQDMVSSMIIYVGYSHDDPNWKMILQELMDEFSPSPLPPAYRVAPGTPDINREILNAQKITTIDATLADFVAVASAALGELHVDPASLEAFRKNVPSDLQTHFDANAASVLRLLSSWTYVNQAPFTDAPNVSHFLRGEKPNWGLIAHEGAFSRDVQDPALAGLIDYATAPQGSRPTYLILGSAGYGITTVLMTLAVRLVKESAGPVFMHNPGTPIIEGDITFACSLFPTRPFFIIDDAAISIRAVEAAIEQVRANRKFACFLLGERKNEWKQLPRAPKASEFEIKPLSDPEIERLLACLMAHNELGELEHLSHDLQVAAIQKKHDGQLLVVLREVTEGKAFDAIIESEFRKLPQVSRHCYATVSCAYQLRQSLRDNALAEVVGLPLTEMYDETRHSLEGVVEYDCVDQANGTQAARCRHHVIAEIVWERCVPHEEREDILLHLIKALNLTHPTDAQLFDVLVQSDRNIAVLRTLQFKTAFFEEACRKQPTNPYIRQHYSRMLLREDRPELALREIESALKMQPDSGPLHHTRGIILSHMVSAATGPETARRRMVQAESAFQEAIKRRKRDGYQYHGLASLYFIWVRKFAKDQEALDYMAQAEGVIQAGLRLAHDREHLQLLSSRLQEWLGDHPQALAILEKSANSTTGRYMLASTYMKDQRYADAERVLVEALKADPTAERLAMLYGRCLQQLGKPYSDSIAVLRLAELYGMRDARFVAMFGGLLFMNEQFTESEQVFTRALSMRFPIDEQQAVTFRPFVPATPTERISMTGTVVSVQLGYARLRVTGTPDIYCPRQRVGGALLSAGQILRFAIGFNSRGAVAENIQMA